MGWLGSLLFIISYSYDYILINPHQNRSMTFYHIHMLEQISKMTIFPQIPTAHGNKSQDLSAHLSDSKSRSLPLHPTQVLSLHAIYWWALEMVSFPSPELLSPGCGRNPQGILLQCSSEEGSMILHFQLPGNTHAAGLWPSFLYQGFKRPEFKGHLMLIPGSKSFNATLLKTPLV